MGDDQRIGCKWRCTASHTRPNKHTHLHAGDGLHEGGLAVRHMADGTCAMWETTEERMVST